MKGVSGFVWLGAIGAGLYLLYSHLKNTCTPTSTGLCSMYNTVFGTAAPSTSLAAGSAQCLKAFQNQAVLYFNGDTAQANAFLSALTADEQSQLQQGCSSGVAQDPVNYGLHCPPVCPGSTSPVIPVPQLPAAPVQNQIPTTVITGRGGVSRPITTPLPTKSRQRI